MAGIARALLVAAGAVLVMRHDAGTIAGFDNADIAGIVAALALLIFLGGSMFTSYRGRFPGALRDALSWGALAPALISGYRYRDQPMPIAPTLLGHLP